MSEKVLRVARVGAGSSSHWIDLPLKIVTSTAAILANRGEGKTHVGKVLAEEMIAAGAHVIIGDPTGVWWGLQSSASGKRAGLPVVVFGGEHADVPITAELGAAVADAVVKDRINAVLDMSSFEEDGDKVRFMLAFGKRLFFINRKPVHIFLDEADEFVPQQVEKAPDKAKLLHIFKRIWQRGRVKGIGGTLISQRSAVVNKTLLNLSTLLIALKTVGPTDRDALEGWTESYGTDEQQKEFNENIGRMPKHEAFWFSSEFELFERATARPLKTFDSSATPEVDQDLVTPTAKTAVDIKRLGAALSDAVEKVKADDPVMLRKRIAELEAAIKKAGDEYVHQLHTMKPVVQEVEIKVPILGKHERGALDDLLQTQKMIEQSLHKISNSFTVVPELQKASAKAIATIAESVRRVEALPGRHPMPSNNLDAVKESVKRLIQPAVSNSGRALGIGSVLVEPNGAVNEGAKRRLLVALAQYGELSARRLRVLAGIGSPHTFRKYTGELRKNAWIDGVDPVRLTTAGQKTLGEFEPLPTGVALVDHWKHELGPGIKGMMFVALLSRPGQVLRLDELGKAAGTSSPNTLRKYLGSLRAHGLIEYKPGGIKIAEEFENI